MNISVLGPPACGKGTQAKLLAAHFGLKHFSSGEVLRSEIDRGSRLGQEALSYVRQGSLVPDELVIELFESFLKANRSARGFVLDGYPRTLQQAIALDKVMELTAVVNFEVSEKDILDRVAGRVIDGQGHSYHLTNNPPPPGAVVKRRDDDQLEIARKRYREYLRDIKPITDRYRKRGILISIDAAGSIGSVFNQLLDKLVELDTKTVNRQGV
jgi:adenylate kinase